MTRMFVTLVALFAFSNVGSAQLRYMPSACPNGKCPLQAAPQSCPNGACPTGKCPDCALACPARGCDPLSSAPVARSAAPACSGGSCGQPARKGLFGRVRR
jgi:hypothetical protein